MASYFDTHFTIPAPSNGSAGSAPALGVAAAMASLWNTAHVGRVRSELNAGGREALVVRSART